MPKELNLSWVMRYGYGGGLLYLILLIANPGAVKTYTEAAGPVLAPLTVLAGGACIYVIYRHLFGEWFLYPMAHYFDGRNANNKGKSGAVSTYWYLTQLGISGKERLREAYTALRRENLTEQAKKQLDLAHSEVHILYISFIELFLLGLILIFWRNLCALEHTVCIGHALLGSLITVGALFFLAASLRADIRLHRHEFRTIVPADPEMLKKVHDFLRQRGYIQTASASPVGS